MSKPTISYDEQRRLSTFDAQLDKSKTARRSRNKGKTWERAVARDLRELFPGVKRGWQTRFGNDEADVTGSPFWVECKHHKVVNIAAAVKQAMSDTDGKPILVVSKSDRGEPMATMLWIDFLTLLKKSLEAHAQDAA